MVVGELTSNVDVAIIGAGPGGYVAALRCAQLGLETVLIEKGNLGGVCTNEGCIPSKALIYASSMAFTAGRMKKMGISAKPEMDFRKMQAWKDGVVSGLRDGISRLCRSYGVEVVAGRAFFTSSSRVVVETGHGPAGYEFKHAIIATGSVPSALKGLEFDHKRIIDSSDALSLRDIPKDLVVIGGGYIGIEMATMFAKLGSRVSLVYRGPAILRNLEPELGTEVQAHLPGFGIKLFLESNITGWKHKGNEASALVVDKNGKKINVPFDKMLVAVGHEPFTKELGLEKTLVQLDDKGFIKVDAQRRTTDPNIFAVGDAVPGPMLAHKAFREGKVAAEAIAGKPSAFDNVAIPLVVFSDPEAASAGLGEEGAAKAGYKVKVSRFPLSALGRARTIGSEGGFVKIISDADSGVVLGAHIAAHDASEMISEMSLAIEMGAQLEDIAGTIHPHPSFSEAIMESAEQGLGKSVHLYSRIRK